MQSKLVISFSIVSSLCLAQQQQLSNTMVLNNSNSSIQILSNNSRGNFSNINISNVSRNSNTAIQSNKIKANQVRLNSQRNTTSAVGRANATNVNNIVKQRNRANVASVSGPNNRSNLTNLNVNDNPVNANDDNNLSNQFDNQQLLIENNANPIQIQQSVNLVEQNTREVQNENANNSKSINISLNLNLRSFSSSSSSSISKTNRHTFSKKMKKFERHFFGKIGSHKKSKHLVDVCFNWSK